MDKREITKAYQSQKQYFNHQTVASVPERIKLLKVLKQIIKQKEEDIIAALDEDFRKPEFETLTTELLVVYKEINLFIKNLKKWQKPERVSSDLINFPSSDKIFHVPLGNILVISPWNYPFQLAITPLIGAIATGNTVILKPSEYAPKTAQILEIFISEVFKPEVCQVIQGDAETADYLLDLKWDFVFFTGSVNVGKIVSQKIAKNMTPHCLELGGKNPCIIDETAKINTSAKRILWGKFLNAGQTCIAPDYLLVHENILNEFIESLQNHLQNFYSKDAQKSEDYARIISQKHFERLVNLLENQNIISGGQYEGKELFIEPTLVLNPDLESKLMKEEIFGPILPIIGYKNEKDLENIILKNDKPLALYVFSKKMTFQDKMIQKYDFGGGVINDTVVHFVNDKLPFGGVGKSGVSNYHGKHSFNTFTRQKSVVNRKTYLDVPIKYPPYNKISIFKKLLKFFR